MKQKPLKAKEVNNFQKIGAKRKADIKKYEISEELAFCTSYAIVQRVEYLVEKIGVNIARREFLASEVEWSISANIEKLLEFRDMLGRDAKWSV